jgi:hypothetical protein
MIDQSKKMLDCDRRKVKSKNPVSELDSLAFMASD